MAKLLESAGLRIDDINETTRSAIVDTLTEGTRRGIQHLSARPRRARRGRFGASMS
jgi:hypothetical protein